jgi:hypothetical protein
MKETPYKHKPDFKADTIAQAANPNDDVFEVTADYVENKRV